MTSSPIRILAVDDEPDLCALTKEFLERSEDMEVDIASSVREAMDALDKKQYSVIVSDYQMPNEDGILFLKSLRGKGNLIPFILFTGKGREEVVIEALNNGADSYLQKGGKPTPLYTELEHRIRETVRRHDADKDVEQTNLELCRANEELAAAKGKMASQLEEILAGNEEMAASEEELRETEARYRSLFENMINGAAIHEILCDANGVPIDYRFLELNSAFEKMTGLSRGAVVGRTVHEALQQVEPIWIERYGRVALTGVPDHFESFSEALGKHYEVTVYRNAPRQFTVIITDATDRKRAEDELRESEEKFRVHIENSSDVIFTLDGEGKFIFISPAWERHFGYPVSDVLGRSFSLFVHPDDVEPLTRYLARILSTRQSETTLAYRVKHANGGWLWFITNGTTHVDDEGKVRFIGVGRNVTEQKLAEEELKISSEKYQLLLRSLPIGVTLTNDQGEIIESNEEAMRLLGLSLAEQERRTIAGEEWKIIRPDGTPMPPEEFASVRALKEKTTVNDVEMGILKGDDVAWINVTAAPVPLKGYGVAIAYNDITGRKLAEEDLRETKEYLQNLLDYANAPIIVWNSDLIITTFNHAFERLTGMTSEQVIGKSLEVLFPDEARSITMAFIRETSINEFWNTVEIPIRGNDGSVRTVLWNSATLTSSDGRIIATIAQGQDITERKRAEENLRTTKEYLQNLLDYANAPIIVWNSDLIITSFNHAFERLTGMSSDKVVSRSLDILFPEETTSRTMHFIRRAIAGERWEDVEIPIRGNGGSVRTVLWNSATLTSSDGRIIATIAQGQDITERKRVEEALIDREEYLRTILQTTADGFWMLDVKGNVTEVNETYCRMSGYSRDEMLRLSVSDLEAIEDRNETAIHMKHLIENGSELFETRHRRKDGSVFEVEVSATFMPKGVDRVICFCRDITERKRAEKALQEAGRKLNLLSSITRHDINNHLMVLTGHLALLEEKQVDPSSNQHLQKAEVAAERISAMIRFTKTYEDIGVLAPIWQDVRELVRVASTDVPFEKVRLLNDIPTGTKMFADPLVTKVFHNLMHNSMRHGSNITTIRFYVEERNGVQTIICEDDGIGIPEDMKEKLFTQGFGKDHGLGLFLSREILSITGITINEEGEPGKGARFVMTMPQGGLRTT